MEEIQYQRRAGCTESCHDMQPCYSGVLFPREEFEIFRQEKQLGTGHAVLSAGPFLELRARLVATGVLAREGDHYVFTKDHEFSSPSYAAGTVCGGHMNGLTAWKTEAGMTLKQLEDSGE